MSDTGRTHLFLAGFMGTGKSTVGRAVAKRLRRTFVDLDVIVEQMRHRLITDIFRDQGEPAFRKFEARALRMVVTSPGMVIAVGGGAPTTSSVRRIMRHCGRTVLLTADWNALWRRVQSTLNTRPLLPAQELANAADFAVCAEPILRSRAAAYHEVADWTLDTSLLGVTDVVDRISAWYTDQINTTQV
ncbi:MAG: shikimate kinase [candidate division Zixibacteria bacterium]|nr:shikimate kinase [candidate division Zixibacteria bacterium]